MILTRNPGESIFIGDDIKVTVMEINRNQVRIGIEAPRAIEVDREEIRDRKNRERKENGNV